MCHEIITRSFNGRIKVENVNFVFNFKTYVITSYSIHYTKLYENAANNILLGLHCPKIKTAKAKNPYPETVALKLVDVGITNINPPIPANAPDINTPA